MGLQLSVLVGCVGALELLACLRHVFVCVMKMTDQPANCCIEYFHRSKLADDFVMVDTSSLEEETKTCSEIEAILRETRSEPDVLCIGPPPTVDGYVRVPTPIPFDIEDQEVALVTGQKSSSPPSSLIDSGNENPTMRHTSENVPSAFKRYHGSSSDVSSLEEAENVAEKPKKVLRRSKTPEAHLGSYEDYDDGEEEATTHQKKQYHKMTKVISTSINRKSTKLKSKGSELGRSVENLSSTTRRSKRHREPERCKSDIQIQVARNLLRDEWTNTSPRSSEGNLSRSSSKRSVSVLIQTSFEDKLDFTRNSSLQNLDVASKLNTCPNCRCQDDCRLKEPSSRIRRITETESVDGKPQLLKISSFEEASGDDYEKLKDVLGGSKRGKSKNWAEKVKSSIDSETSYDEYVDATEEGLPFSEQPIQYSIPDPGGNQAFWVTRRISHTKTHIMYNPTTPTFPSYVV